MASLFHKDVPTSEIKLLCPYCPEATFPNSYSFKHHMNRHDPKRKFNFVCRTCGSAFEKSQTLKRHEIRHEESPGYSCIKCGATFQRKDNRHRHQKKCDKEWGSGRGREPVKPRDRRRQLNNGYALPQASKSVEYIEDKVKLEDTRPRNTVSALIDNQIPEFPSNEQLELTLLDGSAQDTSEMSEWSFHNQYNLIDPLLLGQNLYEQSTGNYFQNQVEGSEHPNQQLETSAFSSLDSVSSSFDQTNFVYPTMQYYGQGLDTYWESVDNTNVEGKEYSPRFMACRS
ncbi:hypothetical protein EDC01DRAFT_760001 [Geopyxis carbonaria]|nr:hypothetical protein EDC01DRAFT_760001 [Geopyxis carbonaria]